MYHAKQLCRVVRYSIEPGKIACHLEGSRKCVLVTGAIDCSATRVGAGKVSLLSDFTGDRPMADLTRDIGLHA